MSITVSATPEEKYTVIGNRALVNAKITMGSSYPSGGESFDPEALFGMHNVDNCMISPAGGYIFQYDSTNKKIQAYNTPKISQAIGQDIKGSANTDAETSDGASLPTNGSAIVSADTQANVATAKGVLTVAAQPDIARNVCFCVTNDSGGTLNLFVGTVTIRITGKFKGSAQTEDITITVTDAQKAIANGKFRYKYGVRPFDTITSITQPNYATDAMADGLKISVGLGSKVGLYDTLLTPAEADVFKITVNSADLAITKTVDTTNQTVNLGARADNDDFVINYRSKGYASREEVASGTDLSGVSPIYVALIGI